MGSLFSSKQTAQSSGDPVAMEAFNLSKPFILQGLQGTSNLYNQVNANPAFTGQRVANLNPFQITAANNLGDFTNSFTPAASNTLGALGFSNIGASANVGNNAANIFSRASGDPTQQILATANTFANNPFINGLIDASSRDVTRNLFENQIPGINRAASGTGNLNSTRAGVQQAIAERGAGDRLADLSSQIRSQFFGQGLNMGQNQFNQNLTNMLNANNQLLNSGNFGINAFNNAQSIAGTGAGQGITAGDVFKTQEQANLDANKAVFDESLANRLAVLSQLTGAANAGRGWQGGPQSTTTTSSGNVASSLGGLLLGGASAAKAFGFSDIRMKENIKAIGKTPAGLSVYSYEYKPEFKDLAGHGVHVGVMAQEVESVIPEAVSVASNGYKMVDYSLVR